MVYLFRPEAVGCWVGKPQVWICVSTQLASPIRMRPLRKTKFDVESAAWVYTFRRMQCLLCFSSHEEKPDKDNAPPDAPPPPPSDKPSPLYNS